MGFIFESFALVVFIIALAAGMAWRNMRWAAEPLEEKRDQRAKDAQTEDFQMKQAMYNDSEHGEFCSEMEPFYGEGKKP